MNDQPDMMIEVEKHANATLVKPSGDIDLSRSPELRHQLMAVWQDQPTKMIINLAEVPYMDSSGVATLVEAMQHSRKTDTPLVLCNLQERVRSIFEIARLETVFTITDSVEAAIEST